jgi:phosphoribosylformylglycinamidine synthase
MLLRGSEPGDATDAEVEFGSSEYAKVVLGELWGFPPALELEGEAGLQKAVVELGRSGLIDSAHDCSDGGLAVALARCAFQKGIGCTAELRSAWTHSTPSPGSVAQGKLAPEFVLFGEDASRIVISCDPANVARIKEVAGKHGISADVLGETVSGNLEIKVDGHAVIAASIAELRDVYENALEQALRAEPAAVAAD